jgi:diguanylate cyclase
MTSDPKKAARSMPMCLTPGTPLPTSAAPIGERALPAWASTVAGPCRSALGSWTAVSGNSGVGPLGGSPAVAAGRAALAVRRAVRLVGGGALAAAGVMMAVFGLWQVFRWGGREHQALVGDLSFLPVNGAAILMAWRASRRADLGCGTCRAWRLLTVALILYAAGDVLQLVSEVVVHRWACPAWADAARLGFYPAAFAGLVSFPVRRRSGPERLRLLLDAGMVFTGGAMLIWYLALGPAIAARARFDLPSLVTYAYPAGDLLLLFVTLAVLLRGPPLPSVLALRIFAVGMLAFIAADLTYDRITAYSAYLGGDRVDTLWMLALIMACLSAACQLRTTSTGVLAPSPKPPRPRSSLLPCLAIVSSCLLLLLVGLRSVRFDSVRGGLLLAGAVALTFLVSVRQHMAMRDYGRLAVRYQELASVDGMTGVCNRRHLMEAAEAAVAGAQRLREPLVALMLDVDSFKQINDTHGHIAGDQVLAEIAQACREQVRPGDIVGRYGGDEFTIIIVGITGLRAIQLADQLARPAARVLGRDGKPLTYSASIGIAECLPGWDLPTLLMHADLAMYEAKRAGGGSWRIFAETTRDAQTAGRRHPGPAIGGTPLDTGTPFDTGTDNRGSPRTAETRFR